MQFKNNNGSQFLGARAIHKDYLRNEALGQVKIKNSYRAELEGLRALAVLAVIIYHAELTWRGMSVLPGGFLGVDVFFVLSGFLITGILIERQPDLLSFYKGRVDRIYPALLLMLLLSCFAAYRFLSYPHWFAGILRISEGGAGLLFKLRFYAWRLVCLWCE